MTDDVLTAEAVAGRLGVSVSTVCDQARRGLIPGRKVGKEWRYCKPPKANRWFAVTVTGTSKECDVSDETKISLGGLWKQTSKNGTSYLAGGFTVGSRIMVFANTYKTEGGTEPDYKMYLVPKEKRDEKPAAGFDGAPGVDDDDIPFDGGW